MARNIRQRLVCFIAELAGTLVLCFIGCMSCLQWTTEPVPKVQAGLAFSMSIMLIIQIFGHISGAHLNPAVSLSAFIQGIIDLIDLFSYAVAQIIGAFIGFGLLKFITPVTVFNRNQDLYDSPGVCSTVLHTDLSPLQGVFIETVATGLLILAFCAVSDPRTKKNSDSTPLRFGFLIFALGVTTGPYTGNSMNPARTLAPAYWNEDWDHHWVKVNFKL